MSEFGPDPESIGGGESNFFDCSTLESVFQRLKTMQEKGLTLKGSGGDIDPSAIAKGILSANEEIRQLSQSYESIPQNKLDEILARNGVTRTGNLRSTLLSVFGRMLLDRSQPSSEVYAMNRILGGGTAVDNQTKPPETFLESEQRREAESREMNPELTAWKEAQKETVFSDSEFVVPEVTDPERQEEILRWQKEEGVRRMQANRAGRGYDDSLSMGNFLKNFLLEQAAQEDPHQTTVVATLKTESGDRKVVARMFTIPLTSASRGLDRFHFSVLSDHIEINGKSTLIEENDKILGVVLEGINGQDIEELSGQPSTGTIDYLLQDLNDKVNHEFGLDLHLADAVRNKISKSPQPEHPFTPPLRNSEGKLIDPRTNEPVRRDSAYGRELHQRGYLR